MVHTHGWVRRKVKNSDKWVRRWLEVNKHVLYSYQSCPADMPSARVMNMLDLRKTRTIDVVDGEEGLFVIVPQSADDAHPGYLMKAESRESALAWVAGLNVRASASKFLPPSASPSAPLMKPNRRRRATARSRRAASARRAGRSAAAARSASGRSARPSATRSCSTRCTLPGVKICRYTKGQ